MFEKDLARDRASDGKEDETEYKERHNFSSARATGRAMKNTPNATRKIPIQRRNEIASPRKSPDPIATMIWFVAARLKAMIKWDGLQRVQPGKERADNRKNSQPDPKRENIGNTVPRGHKLRVDSNLQEDLGKGGQNHADKELKVGMTES